MLMTRAKNLCLVLVLSISALWLAPAQAQYVEGVRALVNDEPITTVDVRNRMRLIIASTGLAQVDQESLTRIETQALRGLIDEVLQLQAAREFEVEVTDEEVYESIVDLAVRNGTSVDSIIADLQQSGVDISTLQHQLEAEIAWQIIVNGRYSSRIRISTQQIEMALERLAVSASQPQFRIFELFIGINNVNDEDVAVERMINVMEQLQQGAQFPELARQFSDASSAAQGGDIGWITANQLRPEISSILPQMMTQFNQSGGRGALSNPVRVPGGLMIVALVAARDGSTTLQYELVQLTVPSSALTEDSGNAFREALSNSPACSSADSIAASIPGAFSTVLGSIGSDAMLPQISEALSPLRAGDNTGGMQTAAGMQALLVCDREIAGPGVPSRDDLERQLRGQQLSLLSRRWLRDLRRDGTVEIRD